MDIIQVKNINLPDGNRYSGWGIQTPRGFVPHGYGKKYFNGYYIYGNFIDGEVNGPAIESHDTYMKTMQFKNNRGNGWGLCMNRGHLSDFGYYENSQLKIDLIDFALWYFIKMLKSGRDENMLSLYANNNTHQVADLLIGYRGTPELVFMGFHFMADGSVWMGTTDTRRFSGDLIHFRNDGQIDCGRFEDGELIERVGLQNIIDDYYGTYPSLMDDSMDDLLADFAYAIEPDQIREQFRTAMPIKEGYNYFCGLPVMMDIQPNRNKVSMSYHLQEVDFYATGDFKFLGDDHGETWTIGDNVIETPHGSLEILDAIFVDGEPFVGVQFTVSGFLKMNEFGCSNGDEEMRYISTFALMRQPHNVWLWVYTFDENNQPVANFCGLDDLDGLLNFIPFLKRKFR